MKDWISERTYAASSSNIDVRPKHRDQSEIRAGNLQSRDFSLVFHSPNYSSASPGTIYLRWSARSDCIAFPCSWSPSSPARGCIFSRDKRMVCHRHRSAWLGCRRYRSRSLLPILSGVSKWYFSKIRSNLLAADSHRMPSLSMTSMVSMISLFWQFERFWWHLLLDWCMCRHRCRLLLVVRRPMWYSCRNFSPRTLFANTPARAMNSNTCVKCHLSLNGFFLNVPDGITVGRFSSSCREMCPQKYDSNLPVAERCCFDDFVPAIATCVHWIAMRTNTLKGKMELEWQLFGRLYVQTAVTRRFAWRSFEVRNSRRFLHSEYVFASTIRAIHFTICFHFRTKYSQLKVT